jgi:hypothetical protein
LQIDGPTSYSGETYIGPNMRVGFTDSAALGDANAGTRVDRGYLELYKGGGVEQITLDYSRLVLDQAAIPYGHFLTLRGGLIAGGDSTPATLSQRVDYTEGAILGIEAAASNLVLAGGISGVGSLEILNKVDVRNGLAIRGNLYVRGRSGAVVSGPLDVAGEVFISERELRLLAGIEHPATSFRVVSSSQVPNARLTIDSSATLRRVLLDPRDANSSTSYANSGLFVIDGAAVAVADDLQFFGGVIRGVTGQTTLKPTARMYPRYHLGSRLRK